MAQAATKPLADSSRKLCFKRFTIRTKTNRTAYTNNINARSDNVNRTILLSFFFLSFGTGEIVFSKEEEEEKNKKKKTICTKDQLVPGPVAEIYFFPRELVLRWILFRTPVFSGF